MSDNDELQELKQEGVLGPEGTDVNWSRVRNREIPFDGDEPVDPDKFLAAAGVERPLEEGDAQEPEVPLVEPVNKMTAERVDQLLDNPHTILEQLYDLGVHRLSDSITDLRQKREDAVTAKLEFEKAFRNSQLIIAKEAGEKGAKMTIAERELKAAHEVEEQKFASEMAQARSSSAQDVVFLIKDQINVYQNLLMWKQSELRSTPSAENSPAQQDPNRRPW